MMRQFVMGCLAGLPLSVAARVVSDGITDWRWWTVIVLGTVTSVALHCVAAPMYGRRMP